MVDQEQVRKAFERRFYADDDFTLLVPDSCLHTFLGIEEEKESHQSEWSDYCLASVFGNSLPDRRANNKQAGSGPLPSHPRRPRHSFEFQELVHGEYARLQVSRAYGGRAWTITVRWNTPKSWPDALRARHQIEQGYSEVATASLEKSPWKPNPTYTLENGTPILFSFEDIVGATANLISKQVEGPDHGLVLVTGRTGSGKSQVARGLVWQVMREKSSKASISRRPHLVTFEDPIEQYFAKDDGVLTSKDADLIERNRPFDYTPRQKFRDCYSLAEVVSGALRQTPTALYIGEIRTPEEFAQAMTFAGTGHLVVATAHAGNLVESVGRLLDAVGASDASIRARYVPRILAVVHMALVKTDIVGPNKQRNTMAGLVPALYRRTTRGMQSLVADGLFSLMPGYSRDPGEIALMGSLGRQYLADALSKSVSAKLDDQLAPDNGETLLAKDWSPARWRALAQWNRGEASESAPGAGRRLIDVALELDVHGR
jgi:hypothetical protein